MAKPKATRFSRDEAQRHVSRKHPQCPVQIAEEIIEAIVEREWKPPVSIGKAFGIVATNKLRHEHTNYNALLRECDLDRSTARARVAGEIRSMISSWRRTSGV